MTTQIKIGLAAALLALAAGITAYQVWPRGAETPAKGEPVAQIVCPKCGASKTVAWRPMRAALLKGGGKRITVPCSACGAMAEVHPPGNEVPAKGAQ